MSNTQPTTDQPIIKVEKKRVDLIVKTTTQATTIQEKPQPANIPTIEKTAKSSGKLLFTKNSGETIDLKEKEKEKEREKEKEKAQEKKQEEQQQPQISGISIEKKTEKNSLIFGKKKTFTMEEAREIMRSQSSSGNMFTRRSVGYISLMNYLKDQTTKVQKPFNTKVYWSSEAELLVKNEDRYVPAHMAKKAKVWEDDSDEAFLYSANFLLNRLTESQLPKTMSELLSHIKNDEHRNFVADIIVEKALNEHAFSTLYAKLTKEINDGVLRKKITDLVQGKFDDYVLNIPNNESDGMRSAGCAKFIGALISNKVCLGNASNNLTILLDKLKETSINVYLVEMLEAFILTAGKDFTQQVTEEQWKKFDAILESEGTRSRKGCLLLNIQEQREAWLDHIPVEVTKAQIETRADEIENIIRNAYCEFQEGTEVKKVDVTSTLFVSAALRQIPDHIKDGAEYALFIVSSVRLTSNPDALDSVELLKDYSKDIEEQNLVADIPKIWTVYFGVLVAFYAFGLVSNPQEILETFPKTSEHIDWDCEAKYFIYDVNNFTHCYNVKHKSLEIADALAMPDLIDKRNEKSNFSRLIAVAICRVVINKIFNSSDKEKDVILKYSSQLKVVFQRFNSVFKEEFDAVAADLPIPKEDIIRIGHLSSR